MAIDMYRLTNLAVVLILGATGLVAAQEATTDRLDYNPPIVRTGHDTKPKHYGAPGRQIRGDHAGSHAERAGAMDTLPTASIGAGLNSSHQPHRPYGNYGPQITEWDLRSGGRR